MDYEQADIAVQKGSALELDDAASVDADVATQIRKGMVDAADLASADELEQIPRQTMRRKVKKKVEVPVVRKVKVPTTTQKLVEDVEIKKVITKKQVQEPSFKWVEEPYVETVDQPATRVREIWVKKLVKEPYMKKVEVVKMRKIKVPCTVTKEVEVEEEVKVPTTRVVDVPSFRIDEIKDTKVVEVEGWQEVELVPRVKETAIKIDKSREIIQQRRKMERRVGQVTYDEQDTRLDTVDTDSDPSDEEAAATVRFEGDVRLDGTEKRTKRAGSKRVTSTKTKTTYDADGNVTSKVTSTKGGQYHVTQPLSESPAAPIALPQIPNSSPRPVNGKPVVPTGAPGSVMHTPKPPSPSSPGSGSASSGRPTGATPQHKIPTPPQQSPPNNFLKFGFRLVEKGNQGLLITQVVAGGYAEMYELKVGDLLEEVDTKAITSINAWRSHLQTKIRGQDIMLGVLLATGERKNLLITLDEDFEQ